MLASHPTILFVGQISQVEAVLGDDTNSVFCEEVVTAVASGSLPEVIEGYGYLPICVPLGNELEERHEP